MPLISLEKITWDEKIYPRTGVDWITAHKYAEAMKAGEVFPPIDVVLNPNAPGEYIGLDGRHRYTARQKNHEKTIDVRVMHLTGIDRYLHAIKTNLKHGRPLSMQERLQIAKRLQEDFGKPITYTARFLHIPKKSLLKLLSERTAPRGALGKPWTPTGSVPTDSAVLKAPFQHLAGTRLPPASEGAQRFSAASSQTILLDQVMAFARSDTFDLKDPRVRDLLRDLSGWLVANARRLV